MNQTLPILSIGLATVIGAAFVLPQLSQTINGKEVKSRDVAPDSAITKTDAVAPPNGNILVRRAARQLLALPGIEAKTRQRVDLFGQHLVGSGNYLQWVQGPQLLLRLDLKLQMGQQVTSVQQISDGQIFWTRTDLPHQKNLVRVNLRRLREAASRLPAPPPPAYWMALGGMPKLLDRLAEEFEFDAAEPKMIGHLPVWKIEGHWKPRVLKQLLPKQSGPVRADDAAVWSQLEEPLPHGVTLILGRDEVIPLFPYRVSFFRYETRDEDRPKMAPARQPVATLELFEVRLRPDLTPADFDYRPGSQEVKDQTSAFIAQLKNAGQVRVKR